MFPVKADAFAGNGHGASGHGHLVHPHVYGVPCGNVLDVFTQEHVLACLPYLFIEAGLFLPVCLFEFVVVIQACLLLTLDLLNEALFKLAWRLDAPELFKQGMPVRIYTLVLDDPELIPQEVETVD